MPTLLLALACVGPAQTSSVDRRKLEELDQRAETMIRQDQFEEAKKLVDQALAIAPRYYRSLYRMACIQSRQGQLEAGMDYLERAADEGFTDFIRIQNDPLLAPLRGLDRYKKLIARKDEIQRADADRTLLILQRQFGQGYLYEVDPEHKLIFAVSTDRPTLDALKGVLAKQMECQCRELFANRPDQYIIIVLPTLQRFAAMSRPGVGGAYDHNNHLLIAQRLGQLMMHEFTHALHDADLDPLGQTHPAWICEGLASLYEGARFKGDQLVPADNYRLADIQRAFRESGLISLSRLIRMDSESFNRAGIKAYGQAGSLLLYLYEQGRLRQFYDTYKAMYAKDTTGRLALERVTGRKLAELERDWTEWMLNRRPPVQRGGVELGLRFGEAHDALPIVGVQAGSPAGRAGLKTGDAIVGVDGADVRDAYAMISLLGEKEAGAAMVLRIRRRGAYLDVPVRLGTRPEAR